MLIKTPDSYQRQKVISVCCVFNQHRDINSFEIQTIKIPENETKLDGISLLRIDGFHPERAYIDEVMLTFRN